jgi:hypothetical protein
MGPRVFRFSTVRSEPTLSGSITLGSRTSVVAGSGTIRGALVTKYLNVITRRSVSAGFALGAGGDKASLTISEAFSRPHFPSTNNILRFCRCSKRSRKWISVRSVIFLSRPISECDRGHSGWGSLSESTTAWLNQKDGSREAAGHARDTAGRRRSEGHIADGNTRKPAVLGIAPVR